MPGTDELLFFDSRPGLLPLYTALRDKLYTAYPDMEIRVSKTQISFRNRYLFAMASLPRGRRRGWPEEYLLVSFGLGRQQLSPRIPVSTQAYPGRWTHHVPVQRREELDGELMGWIDEAYQFSAHK